MVMATGKITAEPTWKATALNPSAADIASIIATAEDMIIRVYIPSVGSSNFDVTQAIPAMMLRNMEGTHVLVMSGYYWDSNATMCLRLNVSSTSITMNRCSINGADKTAYIQLYYRM